MVGTCKLKGIDPYQWLKNIFEVLLITRLTN
ncbi:MAG: transposase domain-containing protein [Bacteroidetes bacterium]|nr:transposase domain-containing protein [Bacteroidota bacterium]